MKKYQLWRGPKIDADDVMRQPLMLYEHEEETTVLEYARARDLSGNEHYIAERVSDEKDGKTVWFWNENYYAGRFKRYLNEFPMEETREQQERRHEREHSKLGNEALQQELAREAIQDTDIKVSGFIIHSRGDHSVGIWDSTWSLYGDCIFQDKEELEGFRNSIRQAFEYVADPLPDVMSFEEHEALIDMEDRLYVPEGAEPIKLDEWQEKALELFPELPPATSNAEQRIMQKVKCGAASQTLRKMFPNGLPKET